MLLRVPRACLGVSTSGKGLVAGRLHIQQKDSSVWTDCSGSVCSIPGDMRAIQGFQFGTDARHGITSLH